MRFLAMTGHLPLVIDVEEPKAQKMRAHPSGDPHPETLLRRRAAVKELASSKT